MLLWDLVSCGFASWLVLAGRREASEGYGGECVHSMHSRGRMTIDACLHTMLGRTWVFTDKTDIACTKREVFGGSSFNLRFIFYFFRILLNAASSAGWFL